MTPEQLAREALDLAKDASPGPWEHQESSDRGGSFGCGPKHNLCLEDCEHPCSDAIKAEYDAAFIAHAGTHYATIAQSLLDTLAQLKAAGERELDLRKYLLSIKDNGGIQDGVETKLREMYGDDWHGGPRP